MIETNLKKHEQKEKLIEKVIDKIKDDLLNGDETAIFELLSFTPTKYLKGFLPERELLKH